MPETERLWVTIESPSGVAAINPDQMSRLTALVGRWWQSRVREDRLREELSRRLREIDLLYSIGEILGRPIGMKEAARTILAEVGRIMGVTRASMMVYQVATDNLVTVAALGGTYCSVEPLPANHPASIAARVFREQTPAMSAEAGVTDQIERGYQTDSYLCVPIRSSAPGGSARCTGVINLTDRIGGSPFTDLDRRLLEAVGHQVGAAMENARLAAEEHERQRLSQELSVAHELQRKLLPDPRVLQGHAKIGLYFDPVDSVGGDFYTFSHLGQGRISVMMGDVSSHGLSAALVMATVLGAAGIFIPGTESPDQTLHLMRGSLAQRLTSTDTYLTVFYGVLDPTGQALAYCSAGHPNAFKVLGDGTAVRLPVTSPPMGLADEVAFHSSAVAWKPASDLLCLWTDGLVDATNPIGEPYGEARLLRHLSRLREQTPETIVQQIIADVDAFSPDPQDDRTLLILRL